jgi:hypothetical protein
MMKAHQASWFFQLQSVHSTLTKATNPITVTSGLWTACSPLTSAAVSSFRIYRIVCGFFPGYKCPLMHQTASPIFSKAPLAFWSTPTPNNPLTGSVILRLALAIIHVGVAPLALCCNLESHMEVICYHLPLPTTWQLLIPFHYLMFSIQQMLPDVINSTTWQCIKVQWYLIEKFYLAR